MKVIKSQRGMVVIDTSQGAPDPDVLREEIAALGAEKEDLLDEVETLKVERGELEERAGKLRVQIRQARM